MQLWPGCREGIAERVRESPLQLIWDKQGFETGSVLREVTKETRTLKQKDPHRIGGGR